MLQVAAPPRPPGGRRVADAEVARRLRLVEGLMTEGRSRNEMAAVTGLPLRTLDSYTKRVRGRWHEQALTVSQDARGRALDRLFELRARLVEVGSWANVVSLERLITTLEGAHESSTASRERPRESTLADAPNITADWIRDRAPMLINASATLASNSADEALRSRVRQALSRGLTALEAQEGNVRDGHGARDT